MFENKMDCKYVHVLKKSPDPDSPLRVQVPGKGDHANIAVCFKCTENLDFCES